jgi:hypothetical protein
VSDVPDPTTFESAYAGQAPWDIGRRQNAFLDVADRMTGSILDAGCGTGKNALFNVKNHHRDGAGTPARVRKSFQLFRKFSFSWYYRAKSSNSP